MKKIFIYCLLLLLSACGQGGSDNGPTDTPMPGVSQNPVILSYVEAFEQLYGVDVTYTVDFDEDSDTGGQNPNGTTVGVCKIWSNGYREVRINQDWWSRQADVTRRVLIFHELGHCSFDRGHDSRKADGVTAYNGVVLPNNAPLSMMYPIINPIVTYYSQNSSYQNYYENELVTGSSATWAMSDNPNASMMFYSMPEDHSHEDEDPGDCVKYMD